MSPSRNPPRPPHGMAEPPLDRALLHLRCTSGREWHLRPMRSLSASVQVVQEVSSSRPSAAPLVMKTVTIGTSDTMLHRLESEIALWRRAHALLPDAVLPLVDVCVQSSRLHLLTPYCPNGDLASQRPERSALRLVAVVCATLDQLHVSLRLPAHANLHPTSVYLDHLGVPRLAGWGHSRVRALRRTPSPTEVDDVHSLATILYSIIFAHAPRSPPRKLPDTPQISSLTANLLTDVLIHRHSLPLHVFRYDLAAARGLVPPSGPALAPLPAERRHHLDADLDSTHGLNLSSPTPSPASPPRADPSANLRLLSPPIIPVPAPSSPLSPHPQSPSLTRSLSPASSPPPTPQSPTQSSTTAVEQIVKAATAPDLTAPPDAQIDALIDICASSEQATQRIFKVLFRLPISKNPILAFKAVFLLHRFVADGSAKLTAQAITNDNFLSWIESCWSRDRISHKAGKLHMYTYCFAAGDISWYTTVVRKRCEIHARFADTFTTHWAIRPSGAASLAPNCVEAFRMIVTLAEKCSTMLLKAITSGDPAANIRRAAVPLLVLELSKIYKVLCWIYCTANAEQRRLLGPDLELAHNATRKCMLTLSSNNDVCALCHPVSVLDLPESPSESFDEAELLSTLKQLRKKKKRKSNISQPADVAAPMPVKSIDMKDVSPDVSYSQVSQDTRVDDHHSPDDMSKEERSGRGRDHARSSKAIADNEYDDQDVDNDDNSRDDTDRNSRERDRGRKERRKHKNDVRQSNGEEDFEWHDAHLSGLDNRGYGGAHGQAAVSGLRKLSVSVRKGHNLNGTYGEVNGRGRDGSRYSESDSRKAEPRRRRSLDDERSDSGSGDDRRVVEMRRKSRHDKGEYNDRSNGNESSDMESEHSQSHSSDSGGRKKGGKKKSGRKGSLNMSTSSDGGSDEVKKSKGKDKVKVVKKSVVKEVEDYSGGSKEALAAAAEGKKTPNINPEYEVYPYEVQFGPQIGSGGFGVVYKAKFRTETVAVKKIHAHALSNALSVGEFQSEVAVLCTLNHPNILRFVGACTKPPNLMIITEFMARGTLFDLLHQSQTRVTWPMRKKFAVDTCRGMKYLHDSKLLHRDLKSSNLMLDRELNCKVGDFGLTRISKGSAAVQMTGQCGTFQYMAVEVLANKPYSEKADVFSFGILLWEMVARKLPYFGMQPMQVGLAVVQQGLRPTIPPKTPLPLSNLMKACWNQEPSRRPSFTQLVEALEAMPE